jgi:hypothetical protein
LGYSFLFFTEGENTGLLFVLTFELVVGIAIVGVTGAALA